VTVLWFLVTCRSSDKQALVTDGMFPEFSWRIERSPKCNEHTTQKPTTRTRT
jgi:hypothetical protein